MSNLITSLDSNWRTLMVLSDSHGRKRDAQAWVCAMDALEKIQPDTVVLLGDITELESCSGWMSNNLDHDKVQDDWLDLRSLLREVRQKAPNARIIYRGGNHEDRAYRHLVKITRKHPEMRGLWEHLLDVEKQSGAADLGIEWQPSILSVSSIASISRTPRDKFNKPLEVGTIQLIHGHEVSKGAAMIYHARKAISMYGGSLIYAHFHTSQGFSEQWRDGVMDATSAPCLRTIHPAWMGGGPNRWCHGFIVANYIDGMTFADWRSDRCTNAINVVRIKGGEAVFAGQVFRGSVGEAAEQAAPEPASEPPAECAPPPPPAAPCPWDEVLLPPPPEKTPTRRSSMPGEELARIRDMLGFTWSELGDALGVAGKTVAGWSVKKSRSAPVWAARWLWEVSRQHEG